MFSKDRHQIVLLQSQIVVFFCLQVLLLGDELLLIERFLLLVSTLQAVHLRTVFQHVLAYVQLLLLHLDLRVAQDVFFLRQLGLGVQDL